MYESELKVINDILLDITFEAVTATEERKKRLNEEYEALTMAREIILKAVPTPVIEHKVTVDSVKVGTGRWLKGTTVNRCPRCNDFVPKVYKYCGKCGQALKWSK